MMVTFVSQCQKNALKKTRRVLDAFADRIGDNTWQTVITQEGLDAVKKLLRKTASKSTAVSCHWIRSRSRSELVWVVGRRSEFDEVGRVAVNSTELDLEHKDWEDGWQSSEVIFLATSLAALFHDFGKANDLFQFKLAGKMSATAEPYRHEWVSLRLFEAFVADKSDKQWLMGLSQIDDRPDKEEAKLLNGLFKDGINAGSPSPFTNLPDFAKLVAWLIVSHHRLPYPQTKSSRVSQVDLAKDMPAWLEHCFNPDWNSANAEAAGNQDVNRIKSNWNFSNGTPLSSKTWQLAAKNTAKRALSSLASIEKTDWFQQRFVSHTSRLSLMLADHYYSSLDADKSNKKWRDDKYGAHANTDRDNGNQLKQKLDEHNIGVAHHAGEFVRNLPALKMTLSGLGKHKEFIKQAPEAYQWQDKAFNEARQFAHSTETQGFFGINMASTGKGKTIANARILYALNRNPDDCRISVALGLRTLTLQTGDAYRDLLKLSDSELAVLIGSQTVKQLHQLARETRPSSGSESQDDELANLDVSYEGEIYDGRLKHWLAPNPKLLKLISAPLLVSTIDHLMPACESLRGGKQIAPMLRLLTSDLILDEPDDFNLEDLPALCRLVNWAGMLGSRVLLSSATLPPSLVSALFDSYREGRRHFNYAQQGNSAEPIIVTGWFDEFRSNISPQPDKASFDTGHKAFVQKRLANLLEQTEVLRQAKIISASSLIGISDNGESKGSASLYQPLAQMIKGQIHELHQRHHNLSPEGKRVSLGVVRLANIDPLVAIATELADFPQPVGYALHLCIYHSQFPLALRSHKENRLDETLTRHNESQLWQQVEIKKALTLPNITDHIFVVLGTSVVEVGRDHDYDWALAEPSSLRAIIQLAGRIQRHRQKPPGHANIHVLSHNIRALKGEAVAYCKPGFESKELPLAGRDLTQLISHELDNISAASRIVEPKNPKMTQKDFSTDGGHANAVASFAIQEHRALRIYLDSLPAGEHFYRHGREASIWWRTRQGEAYLHSDWNAEFIRQTPFRRSQSQQEFSLRWVDGELGWHEKDDTRFPVVYTPQNQLFKKVHVSLGTGVHWWLKESPVDIYASLALKLGETEMKISERFGLVNLREKDGGDIWHWSHELGVFSKK